jgi:hypothetical protein
MTWDIDSLKEMREPKRRVVNYELLRKTITDVKSLLKKGCDSETREELAKVGIILSSLMVK